MKAFLVLTLAGLSVAACGGAEPPAGPVATDCGTFELGQGEALPPSAARCLIEAARPARLKVTRPTTEGDPVSVAYYARADGVYEVVTDASRDRFGDEGVTRRTCTGPSLAADSIDFGECRPAT